MYYYLIQHLEMIPDIFLPIILLIAYPFDSLSLKCYECTGHVPCGSGQMHSLVNCPRKCMVYQNQYDGSKLWKFNLISLNLYQTFSISRRNGTSLLLEQLWQWLKFSRRTFDILLFWRSMQWRTSRYKSCRWWKWRGTRNNNINSKNNNKNISQYVKIIIDHNNQYVKNNLKISLIHFQITQEKWFLQVLYHLRFPAMTVRVIIPNVVLQQIQFYTIVECVWFIEISSMAVSKNR